MKDDAVYLNHILECVIKIQQYTQGGKAAFLNSALIQDAVFRNFEVIGEASKHISQQTKDRFPNIPWRRIAGFRDILIHNYLGIDPEEVWNIVERQLPNLKKDLESMQL